MMMHVATAIRKRIRRSSVSVIKIREFGSSFAAGAPASPILLNPQLFRWSPIRSLSPSAIALYRACPQSFLLQRIFGLKEPTTRALLKGSLIHKALENLFHHIPESRSLAALESLFEDAWRQTRSKKTVIEGIFASESDQDEWVEECYHLLHNYYDLENPSTITHPTHLQRYIKREVQLVGKDIEPHYLGDSFILSGLYDRLDEISVADDIDPSSNDNDTNTKYCRLIDYKTGKAPDLHYSESFNQQILDDAFEQLVIYALILRHEVPHLRYLRLLHLTTVPDPQQGQWFECDLGATESERSAKIDNLQVTLSHLWVEIQQLWKRRNAIDWKPCCRSFCYCHVARKQFLPGTLAEPADAHIKSKLS